MAQITLDKARELCTAAELQLVRASRRPAVGKLGLDELKNRLDEARRLRDKWRDLSTRQRRETQRRTGSRVTDASARSGLKADLFQDSLDKFQQELDKKSAAAPTAATASKTTTGKVTKQKRAVGHRRKRAATRAELSERQEEMAVKRVKKKKAAKKKAAKKKSAKKATAKTKTATKKKASAKEKSAATKKTTAQKKATKKASTASKKSAAGATTKAGAKRKKQGLKKPTGKQNLGNIPADAPKATQKKSGKRAEVKAQAKGKRILKSGLTTRTRGHVSARGKRAQGRRDSR